MRRIFVPLLISTVVAAAGSTAHGAVVEHMRTPGAEWVSLDGGRGRAVLTRRGSFLVRMRGRVRVIDLPGGTRPNRRCNRRGVRTSRVAVEYRGRDLRCRVWGVGPWQVVMRGSRINVSGVVRGSLTLDAVNSGRTGRFKIGEGPTRPWPRSPKTFVLRR